MNLFIRGCYFGYLIPIVLFLMSYTVAIGSGLTPTDVVLKTVDLNNDSVRDTLIGSKLAGKVIMPRKIIWGIAHDSIQSKPFACKELMFIYPDFKKFNGYYSIAHFNKSDTIIDICFYLNGEIEMDTSTTEKINKMIVLVGQDGLDTLSSIAVDSILKFQTTPYIAYQLRINYELKELNRVDKHKQAFSIQQVYLDINNPTIDSLEGYLPPRILIVEKTEANSTIKVFPNPASDIIYIEAQSDINSYDIRLIDITGRVLFEKESCTLNNWQLEVDVSKFSVGTYQMLISNQIATKSFNILIIR